MKEINDIFIFINDENINKYLCNKLKKIKKINKKINNCSIYNEFLFLKSCCISLDFNKIYYIP